MRVKYVRNKLKLGGIPEQGELFKVNSTIYLCVDPKPCFVETRDMTFGASLESGKVYALPNITGRREGFTLLEPEDGELRVVRKQRVS